jgi:hypothetical protein
MDGLRRIAVRYGVAVAIPGAAGSAVAWGDLGRGDPLFELFNRKLDVFHWLWSFHLFSFPLQDYHAVGT